MSSAILAGLDMSEWAGSTLYSRNATNVAAPALASMHDAGHYPDVMAMLTGWASFRTLSAEVAAGWAGAGLTGTPAFSINSSGFLTLTVTGAAVPLTLYAGVTDPWGWGGTLNSVTSGGAEVITGTSRWTRGRFPATTQSLFTIDDGSGTGQFPSYQAYVHSLPTYLTTAGGADGDAVTECLEKWDNNAIDAGNKRMRWGIDAEGRVFTSWDADLGSSYTVTWVSASFRRMLGFTGDEVAINALGVRMLTATYPPQGLLLMRSGLRVVDHAREHIGSALDLGSGRVAGRSRATWREVSVSADIVGGVGYVEANAAYLDEEQQLLHRVSPYLYPGARATLVPRWDDPRIGRSLHAQLAAGLTPAAQSTTLVSSTGAIVGRMRAEVATGADRTMRLAFASGAPRTRTSASWSLRALDG
jgi:hypothetical protein